MRMFRRKLKSTLILIPNTDENNDASQPDLKWLDAYNTHNIHNTNIDTKR